MILYELLYWTLILLSISRIINWQISYISAVATIFPVLVFEGCDIDHSILVTELWQLHPYVGLLTGEAKQSNSFGCRHVAGRADVLVAIRGHHPAADSELVKARNMEGMVLWATKNDLWFLAVTCNTITACATLSQSLLSKIVRTLPFLSERVLVGCPCYIVLDSCRCWAVVTIVWHWKVIGLEALVRIDLPRWKWMYKWGR